MSNPDTENLLEICERRFDSSNATGRLEAVQQMRELGEPAAKALARAVKNSDAKVRQAASQALSEIGEVGTRTLRNLIYVELNARRKLTNSILFRLGLWIAWLIAFYWLESLAMAYPFLHESAHFLSFCGSSIFTLSLLNNAVSISRQRNLLSTLKQTDDIKLIGLFAICLNEKDKEMRSIAKDALTRLMPRVQASDAQYISLDEMQALVDALRREKGYPNLMLSLLKGMGQIGNERALPNVEALIRTKDVFPAVRQAARDCLPYLQIRAEHAKQAQTLLRASSGSEIAPETLLRPAAGVSTSSSDAQELLRPQI